MLLASCASVHSRTRLTLRSSGFTFPVMWNNRPRNISRTDPDKSASTLEYRTVTLCVASDCVCLAAQISLDVSGSTEAHTVASATQSGICYPLS